MVMSSVQAATAVVTATFIGVFAALALAQDIDDRSNGTMSDAPYNADPRAPTTEKHPGSAIFANDCTMNQTMYVTIRKNFGPIDLVVPPNKTITADVARGDQFAARCGIVVARDAKFTWIRLNGLGE